MKNIFFQEPIQQNLHRTIRQWCKLIIIQLSLSQQIKKFQSYLNLQLLMIDHDINKLHIEYIQEIWFTFSYLYLLYEWL